MLKPMLSNLVDFRETAEVHSQFLMQPPNNIHWQELSVGVTVVHRYTLFTQAIMLIFLTNNIGNKNNMMTAF